MVLSRSRVTPRCGVGGTDWSFKAMEWIYGHNPAAVVETGSPATPPA
jgi:hypothetical protein